MEVEITDKLEDGTERKTMVDDKYFPWMKQIPSDGKFKTGFPKDGKMILLNLSIAQIRQQFFEKSKNG